MIFRYVVDNAQEIVMLDCGCSGNVLRARQWQERGRPNIFAQGENKIYVSFLDIFSCVTFSKIIFYLGFVHFTRQQNSNWPKIYF